MIDPIILALIKKNGGGGGGDDSKIKTTKLKPVPKVSEHLYNKIWIGLASFYGDNIWTDGENIYCSGGSGQYSLFIPTKFL